jgi:UDP-N-acetylmuramyl pentapeptide synthase
VAASTTAVSAPSESLKAAILRHYRGGTINPQDILSKLVAEGRTLDKVTYIYGVLGDERKAHKAAPKAPKAAPVASEFKAPPSPSAPAAVKTTIELADPELRLLMEKAVSEHGLNAAEKLLAAMRARANLIQVRVTG